MNKKKNIQAYIGKNILYVIQGALIGVGAILPGISGGVLCVAFGIYEPMMALLSHPFQSFKQYYKMFIPILIGAGLGFIFLAKGVELLFSYAPTIALLLFFGLICGTIPELIKESEKSDPNQSWTPCILSLALAYLLFHVLESGNMATLSPSFFNYILSGLVWGLSLIIPGLSSSSILIFLGLYAPLTAGIGSLDFSVIIPLFIGIVVTALSLARVITYLLDKKYALISRIILGFMIASSLKILPTTFEKVGTLLIGVICFGIGFFISRMMDLARKK